MTAALVALAALAVEPSIAAGETVEEALAQAYETNPRIAAFRARLRATDESVAIAMSGWRPTVTLSGNVGTSGRTTTGSGTQSGGVHLFPRGDSITLSQNIFRGGRTVAGVAQADANIQSDRALLLDLEQQVLLQAATAYMDVVRDQAVVELNTNNVRVLQRQLEAARDRFQVGEVTRTDVAQAESRLSRARADHVAAEGALANSRAVYQQVVGVAPGTLAPSPPLGGLPASLQEANALAADKSFPVVSAAYVERAARENVDVILGEMLPLVTLNGTLADNRDQSVPTGRTKSATLSVTASVPLYEAGSVTARVRQAKETAAQRRKELDQQVRVSIQAATTAWDALVTARAAVTSFDAQVRAATIALDGVEQEAQVGSRTVLDVLDAEQELLLGQVNLARAQRDVVVQSYTLRAAVAALTATQLRLPVDVYDVERHYNETRYRWWGLSTRDERED